MHPRTAFLLKEIGIGQREIAAADQMPVHNLPKRPAGFGIIGPTGTGKTWELVRRLGSGLDKIVQESEDPDCCRLPCRVVWVNWPDKAEELKHMLASGWHKSVADFVDECCSCQLLYLDDLGQERCTGPEDYSLGVLRNILNHRHREGMKVFWTSNLDLKGLSEIYGSRIVSRIYDAWPPVKVTGQDMRLRRGA